jgi:hypothetical protein
MGTIKEAGVCMCDLSFFNISGKDNYLATLGFFLNGGIVYFKLISSVYIFCI